LGVKTKKINIYNQNFMIYIKNGIYFLTTQIMYFLTTQIMHKHYVLFTNT